MDDPQIAAQQKDLDALIHRSDVFGMECRAYEQFIASLAPDRRDEVLARLKAENREIIDAAVTHSQRIVAAAQQHLDACQKMLDVALSIRDAAA